ncbi:MAG: HAD-IC family P-type ATPase, partial [Nanoarchaeota archaeon]
MTYHSLDIKEVLRLKNTSFNGLNEEEATRRLKEYGENKLKEEKKIHPVTILLRQFNEVVIYILLFAAAISFFLKENLDGYVILAILVFNAILGFVQEYKAERSVELLRKLTSLKTKVIRNGIIKEILTSELIPGDIVYIEAGDKVPADLRIVEAKNLQTNEAALTGESLPCSKQINPIGKDVDLAERSNMLYSGTIVVRGVGKAVVVETGMNTEIGKIAQLVSEVKEGKTPLQVKLSDLGKFLGLITAVICLMIFGIGLMRNLGFFQMLLTAISLAVAAVPEGLPAVVTICLALSVQKMIKKNALIKKLKSIETLGDVTVIASDKTGTLTKNEMTVRKIFVNNKIVEVTGYGYNKEGEFYYDGKKINPKEFLKLLDIAATCNNATETTGDPTEMALLFAALKGDGSRLERIDEIPFDSDKKYMATIHRGFECYKGAPEVILDMCNYIEVDGKVRRLLDRDRKKILDTNHKFAEEALRVLAMAYKKGKDMYFVGMMGMIDPPKEGVKEAIALCGRAGIRSVMITGDHPMTAKAIAHQIGMDGKIFTGKELDVIDDEKLKEFVKEYDIYARTSSYHKVRILKALQANGEIVAMTGDGINDAPALKKADVGVAMSLRGTDVARDAAEMVLIDDNYSSIVNAIEQGRIVYDNIKKFVHYLISANTAEIGVILFSMVFALPLPLLPIHLLWINLMTDSWPALALGVDKPDSDVMRRKPRDPKESIFNNMKGKY